MDSANRPPTGIRLGIARGITYGVFGPPGELVAPMHELGAGLVRVYLYWQQVEPEPGRFDWTIVDRILSQADGEEELWITLCSSSLWATEERTDFLPPSPAKDDDTYFRFVHAVVTRCRGRVQYWQCNNEPSNVPLLWSAGAADYVALLKVMHRAVRDADPAAAVVLGGCGYDVLSSPPDGEPRRFFDHVVEHGREAFDLFAVHLYDDPARIPAHIATVREMMRAHGYERPVVVGEYNGPTLFQFPELEPVLQQTMASAFSSTATDDLSTDALKAAAAAATPERRAMRALYTAMPELPEPLQMFMAGCSMALEERRDRINCREIVTRNLLALSTGVRRTVCWLLAPEVPNYDDPFTMMELMHGKLALLSFDGEQLGRRHPAADTFRLLASLLDGATAVERVTLDDPSELFAMSVTRDGRGPLMVFWRDGDVFSGEDDPAVTIQWPWPHDAAFAMDAFGETRPVTVTGARLHTSVSVTPVFVSTEPLQ